MKIKKQKIKRKIFCKNELQTSIRKSILVNNLISNNIRSLFWINNIAYLCDPYKKFSNYPILSIPNISYSFFFNICVLTGNSHSVYNKFKLSRFILRQLIVNGEINGVTKASW